MFGWLPSSFKGGTGEKGSVKERKAMPREVVKVVVVHSHTGGKKMWEFLEKNWQECGSVKLALSHQRFVPSHCHKRLLVLTKKPTGTLHWLRWWRPIPMSSSAQIQQGLYLRSHYNLPFHHSR